MNGRVVFSRLVRAPCGILCDGPDGSSPRRLLFDAPYDDEYNALRPLNARLGPGDTLATRCDYTPPVFPIDSECEVQVLHWPAHALIGGDAAQASALESCAE